MVLSGEKFEGRATAFGSCGHPLYPHTVTRAGTKIPSVGNPTSLKPSHWRGEHTRRGPISGSSSRHVGTHQIRREEVASQRTVGRSTPTGENPGTHQRDRRLREECGETGRRRNERKGTDNGVCEGEPGRKNGRGRKQRGEWRDRRKRLLWQRGMYVPCL